MQTTFNDLRGRSVRAQDGMCGRVDDLFFDDRSGKVRYLVLALGRWLRTRRVLLEPASLTVDTDGMLSVAMTRDALCRAPHPDTFPPVSRQQVLNLKPHSDGAALAGAPMSDAQFQGVGDRHAVKRTAVVAPASLELTPFDRLLEMHRREQNQAHLRSVREIIGYGVELESGRAGRVVDTWLDTVTWRVMHLSLQLRAAQRRLAVPATLIRGICWDTHTMRLSARWGEGLSLVPRVAPPRSGLDFRGWSGALGFNNPRGAKAL